MRTPYFSSIDVTPQRIVIRCRGKTITVHADPKHDFLVAVNRDSSDGPTEVIKQQKPK